MSAEFVRFYRAIVSDNQMVYSELRNSNTIVNTLLKETVKHSEDTLLHVAANCKRHNIAEIIINLQPSLLFATNARGETPLHVAASVGSEDVTRVIIERCGQIEAVEIGETILRKKTEKKEETALHKAVRNGHLQVVNLLIEKDAELTKLVNKDGESPLFMAVVTNHFEIASSILTVSGCSFNGRKKINALHAAIAYHATEIARDLIEKRVAGLLEQQDDDFGWTPLHYAAHMNAIQTIELLLLAEDSVASIQDSNGMTALHIAAKQGHVRVVEKLVKICPEICGIVDNNGQSFFHTAVKSGRIRVVRFVLGRPYNLLVDIFIYIFSSRTIGVVDFFFGGLYSQFFAGDLLNMQDYQGNTVLHLAALEQHFFILFLLTVDHRLSKSTTNRDGLTVLDIIEANPDVLSKTSLNSTKRNGGVGGLDQLLGRKKIKTSQKTVEAEVDKREDLRQINSKIEKLQETVEAEVDKREDLRQINSNIEKLQETVEAAVEKSSDFRQSNLVVATLIATVSFTAALSVPGGFKNDDPDEGTAALAKRSDFHKFVIFNAIAFCLSVTSILMINHRFYNPRLKFNYDKATLVLNGLANIAMLLAFLFGTFAVLGHSEVGLAVFVLYTFAVCMVIVAVLGQVVSFAAEK